MSKTVAPKIATKTKIEIFPKTDWTSEQVDHVRMGHLAAGAISCEKAELAEAWKLTTVWAIIP